MLKVGITGGIGSGKSFVAGILEKMGYPVYYSDTESKKLVDTDPEIKNELIALLGAEVYSDQGLNRTFLAARLFGSDDIRENVNAIIHPRVRAHFAGWVEEQTADIVFNEAAILFETGSYRQYDAMLLVTAPEALKVERVMKRDGSNAEEIRQRMSRQWTDEEKEKRADYVVINDGRPLLIQVEQIIAQLHVAD